MNRLTESQLELATVDDLRKLGDEHIHGPVIAPDGEAPELLAACRYLSVCRCCLPTTLPIAADPTGPPA